MEFKFKMGFKKQPTNWLVLITELFMVLMTKALGLIMVFSSYKWLCSE
jgi:hypothetical protein